MGMYAAGEPLENVALSFGYAKSTMQRIVGWGEDIYGLRFRCEYKFGEEQMSTEIRSLTIEKARKKFIREHIKGVELISIEPIIL